MMPTAKDFARAISELAETITGYQTGKSGQSGLCDCIGLVMGAMSSLGHGSYPMHSTNYFARYQMAELGLLDGKALRVGQLVYKAKANTQDLNARYLAGGRYYTGDLLDYYHVGVVTSADPLEITHCTSTSSVNGIKRDSGASGWTHVGNLLGVNYGEENTVTKAAIVTVPNGTSSANLRKRPDRKSELIRRISAGTTVQVNESADGWARVTTPYGVTGYMMAEFLSEVDSTHRTPESAQEQGETAEGSVTTITLPLNLAEGLLAALEEVVSHG